MQQSQISQNKVQRNIIWRKWQKIRTKQRQKTQASSNQQTPINCYAKTFQTRQQQNPQFKDSTRKSYNQFVQMSNASKFRTINISWLQVGQPNLYCINYPRKKLPQPAFSEHKKFTVKKLIHSRAYQTLNRFKTEEAEHRKNYSFNEQQTNKINACTKYFRSKKTQGSQDQVKASLTKPQRILKKNNSFEGRPWSHFSKQSGVDFPLNKRAFNF